jgi:hypothetical protein
MGEKLGGDFRGPGQFAEGRNVGVHDALSEMQVPVKTYKKKKKNGPRPMFRKEDLKR